jgi:DNA-binding NarL/FixJ family response regulator
MTSEAEIEVKKTVVVVEDDRGLREQIVQIIETAPDLECLGAYASGEQALPDILSKNPDVVLMDIQLPKMSGIQCVSEIKKVMTNKQVIMVTIYEDSERIFQALKAGANGYLVKSSPPARLLAAISDVSAGGAPMSSPIAGKVVRYFQ